MTNEIFNNEIFNTVNFNHLRKIKTEICRGVTDNYSFTRIICNGVIGALTPDAGYRNVSGTFYATGEALNKFIRKIKQVLGLWNFNCVINIDNNKKYMIINSGYGIKSLSEVNE